MKVVKILELLRRSHKLGVSEIVKRAEVQLPHYKFPVLDGLAVNLHQIVLTNTLPFPKSNVSADIVGFNNPIATARTFDYV